MMKTKSQPINQTETEIDCLKKEAKSTEIPKIMESNAYFQMISHQWKYEDLATTFPKW